MLALGTSNRLARVVDRTRVVAKKLAGIEPGDRVKLRVEDEYESLSAQLDRLQVRAQLLEESERGRRGVTVGKTRRKSRGR